MNEELILHSEQIRRVSEKSVKEARSGGTKKHKLNNKKLKKWIFRQIKRSKSIGS